MQQTQADKKAARDGFKFVVIRQGRRIAYTTTLAEAKRECGKAGKVVAISGMRYAAKNPSSGAKQRARGTRSYGKGLFVEADLSGRHARMLDKAAGIRRKSAKLGPTYTKLMHRDALTEAARVRNPAKQQWYLIDKYGEALVGVGKFSSREAARKKANNMVARDVELTGMLLVSYNDLHGLGHFVDPTSVTLYSRKRRNPSFSKWLDTFLEEKEIDMEEVLTVKGKAWGTNYIPVGAVVRAMKMAPKHEQEAIKTMLVKIDFRNAPVRPYLAHLAQAIAH